MTRYIIEIGVWNMEQIYHSVEFGRYCDGPQNPLYLLSAVQQYQDATAEDDEFEDEEEDMMDQEM